MIRKNRDVKFIIYQVLYIFVLTILALKGADLNLKEVVRKDTTVDKSVRDSLVVLLDSLYAQNLDFKIQITPNVKKENKVLKAELSSLTTRIKDLNKRIKKEKIKKPKIIKKKKKELTVAQSPIAITQTFIQYTWNLAKNTGNIPASIYDPKNPDKPIVTIPAGSQKKFNLTDQKEVILKFGSQSTKIRVVKNQPPKVLIKRVTNKMNASDIYVKELQRITDFTVTIKDERPGQLKVVYSGPISVSKPNKTKDGNLVYNVTLNIASTESRFDDWVDRYGDLQEADGRYKVNFFFTVIDLISKDRVQIGDSFYFTDFSK